MTTRNDHQDHATGQSRFAKRGQSHEERMPEDDSARKFEGSASSQRATKTEDGAQYGSGGSYGYGGAFEHGGEAGHQDERNTRGVAAPDEEFAEATGGFGHDTSGYQKQGIGHPGANEKRGADKASSSGPSAAHPADDMRKGFSQDSGYAQSGGSPANPKKTRKD